MKKDKKIITNKRRSFIKKAGLLTLGAAGATAIKAPYAYSASNPIKWRLQTYSGAPLGAHVIKPQIEAFNKAAYGEMEIELYYADQLFLLMNCLELCRQVHLMRFKVMMLQWDLQ